MKRLLTSKNKSSIKEAYRDNPLLKLVTLAYKDIERDMEQFYLSPEEMWLNAFISFDRIIKESASRGAYIATLWDDICCELRDTLTDDGRGYTKEELHTATSCIVYEVVACLMATNEYEYMQHCESLMFQIEEHTDINKVTIPFDRRIDNSVCDYIKGYISERIFISDTIFTFIRFGRLNDERDEYTLKASNTVFCSEMIYNSRQRNVCFTKLKLFIEEFFVQKCQHSYEWLAVWIFFASEDMLVDREWKSFCKQMNEWFPKAAISCPASIRNYTILMNRTPEEWKELRTTQNLTKDVIENTTKRYETLELNFEFPE